MNNTTAHHALLSCSFRATSSPSAPFTSSRLLHSTNQISHSGLNDFTFLIRIPSLREVYPPTLCRFNPVSDANLTVRLSGAYQCNTPCPLLAPFLISKCPHCLFCQNSLLIQQNPTYFFKAMYYAFRQPTFPCVFLTCLVLWSS